MVKKNYNFTVTFDDAADKKSIGAILVSGDTNVYSFYITLMKDGVAADLSDVTRVAVTFKKGDVTIVEREAEITDLANAIVGLNLGTQEITVEGLVLCTVDLYNSVENQKITSQIFTYSVRKQLGDDNSVKSSNEYSILQKMDFFATKEVVSSVNNVFALNVNNQFYKRFEIETASATPQQVTVPNVPKDCELLLEVKYTVDTTFLWFAGIHWLNDEPPTFAVGMMYKVLLFTENSGIDWTATYVGGW